MPLSIAEGASPLARISERAWYSAPIDAFSTADPATVLGVLAANAGGFSIDPEQRQAWIDQVEFLRDSVRGLDGAIFLEFNIPRMGRRIDVVLLVGPIVFAVEFKVGEEHFRQSALEQVWDYALDLKNFHRGSHALPIVPILVATQAEVVPPHELREADDRVFHPICSNNSTFRSILDEILASIQGVATESSGWAAAPYMPTPTIVEAARCLYARHSVQDILRSEAHAQNLGATSACIEVVIANAKLSKRKAICFVTGVPGAGKTLVGLNIATRHDKREDETHAVFLSGNGPLVEVLTAALLADELNRREKAGESKPDKARVRAGVKAFIQNVHHFRDECLQTLEPPDEHVVIFDEAQRAWTLKKTADFMARRKGRSGFDQSEPEFLISCLDRHKDWATIVCLVGGGQEIHTGEAGIDAWLHALETKFPEWDVYMSPNLVDTEYAAGHAVNRMATRSGCTFDHSLHLSVPMRSFRAEQVSTFVKALLDRDDSSASAAFKSVKSRYPIVLTRDLRKAKDWILSKARGTERYGLLASSRAERLKPHAIDVRVKTDPVRWFLSGKNDTRSSFYLEDAATEFQVQGLELDWACVTWDADFRLAGSAWTCHDFRGTKWINVTASQRQDYVRNAYRVLLTRARQGMAIFVPPGHDEDRTRRPEFYDSTFAYLRDLGIPTLE